MAKGRKTGGRKKGTSNKLSADIKRKIEEAFNNVGGSKYLEQIAKEHPAAFCTLLGKVLPKQVEQSGPDGGPQRLVVELIDPTRPE
jgi:hypothetical protein